MKKLEKNEKILIFGRWTSHLGNIIFDYASNITIVSVYNKSAMVLAIYQSSETLISVIFNLLGGVMADGNNKKRLIIFTDLFSSLVCFILSFFVVSKFVAVILILSNALLAIANAFNKPTYKSIVREMVKKERIGFFNSITNGGNEVVDIVGPMLSLFIVDLIGVQGALLFNAVSFLLSALFRIMLVSLDHNMIIHKNNKRNIFRDIADGFKYLYREKPIFYLIILDAMANFFLAGYTLLIPYTDVMYDGIFNRFYSKVLIMQAVGGIVGSFLSSKLSSKTIEKPQVLMIFFGATGAFLILIPIMSYTTSLILCLMPFLGFGISVTIFNIQFMSYIQIRVDQDYLGRVFSVISTITVLFMPVGTFFFSAVCSVSDIRNFLLFGGGIVILSLISRAFYSSKSCNL